VLAVQDNEVVLLVVNEGLLDGAEDVVAAKEQFSGDDRAIEDIRVGRVFVHSGSPEALRW
jgi:hypothetical protein